MPRIDPDLKIYYVEWIDSTGDSGWRVYEKLDMRCTTVGFLVAEEEDSFSFAPSFAHGTDAWDDRIQIPKIAITGMWELYW